MREVQIDLSLEKYLFDIANYIVRWHHITIDFLAEE